jgi:hypothetical protein
MARNFQQFQLSGKILHFLHFQASESFHQMMMMMMMMLMLMFCCQGLNKSLKQEGNVANSVIEKIY